MHDLTTEYYYHCQTAEEFSRVITGSSGSQYLVVYGKTPHGPYEHDWSCNCKGFQFRGKCKHIEVAKKLHCGWFQFSDGGEPVNGKCPNCGGDIRSMGHGV